MLKHYPDHWLKSILGLQRRAQNWFRLLDSETFCLLCSSFSFCLFFFAVSSNFSGIITLRIFNTRYGMPNILLLKPIHVLRIVDDVETFFWTGECGSCFVTLCCESCLREAGKIYLLAFFCCPKHTQADALQCRKYWINKKIIWRGCSSPFLLLP